MPAVLALLGKLQPAVERHDRAAQNAIVRQLVALEAPMGEQWQQLAYLAAGNGELALARDAADQLVAALGGGPGARFQKAALLALLGEWPDAEALLLTLPDTVPDAATNLYCRGTAALNLGRLDDARDYLDQVTRLRPQAGLAWFSLSMAADLARDEALAERLIAAERPMERAPLADRVPYYHALGATHAARGDHALAFAAFAQGAALMKATAPYDREADRANAALAVEGYTPERIAALAREQREPTARTLFVTGLPRSGTTLVEHILTSHSTVSGGGELSRLHLLAQDMGGPSYPALSRYVAETGTAPAARLWNHWLDELFPVPGRVVDKTVDASRQLGIAAALLPEAPLVWLTRDPLDRAWSCFRTHFAGTAMPWSYDLEHIAAHFRLEDRLLAQWQNILGERLLVIPYEALVTEPEMWIRRLLAHCGLTEEPAVFTPHENRRPVATASTVQVRRPINRQGIGTAGPYREFLRPFVEAYAR